ncbi:hypothetical protein BBJ28_00025477 [Nothophytophthora sp. Chile5]|nr:hypothetical protein BBJ28_00025477 [Nothophytophthora sp. Chile5]
MAAKEDKSPPLRKHWATAGSVTGDDNTAEIIRQIHALYTDREVGLCVLAQSVGLTIRPPRRKVNVLIIGNHSAGKSSFINWYVGDSVQRTGVTIDAQGFSIVTSGSKKTLAPVKGDSTIMLYPYLQPLQEKFGHPLLENLQTRVSVSTEHELSMVDFIDSPGLVDSDIAYPFDVNEAIVYYLAKTDTVSNSKEIMKLMVQITQNIKEHINNQHGLEIPIFWLPTAGGGDRRSSGIDDGLDNDVNQLEEVCETITTAIHQKV